MTNPIIAEITRGTLVESTHRGAYGVSDASGRMIAEAGDITGPVFPRSAIKAFQCVPVIESGAADHFGLTDEEIALCCSSHNGEPEHVRVAQSILRKAGNSETLYECGAHWPSSSKAARDLARHAEAPGQVHNNCSGKHAGMLALARQLGVEPQDYIKQTHPVQKAIADVIAKLCDVNIAAAPVGIDGCSVPTWALPLKNQALGFARLAAPGHAAGRRIIQACRAHPFMVAGTGRFDTRIMQDIPRLFIKTGAEGVYCGCIPHAGLGFALKCDDGASRASEVAIAGVLARLDVWTGEERAALNRFATEELKNWRKMHVGDTRAVV